MKRACLLIRRNWHERTDAFESGLRRLGFAITDNPAHPGPDDILVLWNRFRRYEKDAKAHEAAGAAVLIAENGYIGRDAAGEKLIALARGHHNGAGIWPEPVGDRWGRFGIDLAPWRTSGEHILVLPQRGIGEEGVAMPHAWAREIEARLRKVTRRRIVVRPHPGLHNPPFEPDFSGAHAVVTWGSGAAIKAIAAGVPVFYEFDRWIGAPAARFGIDHLEEPFLGDRMPMFQHLAAAQFTMAEIAEGEPLRCLLAS